MIVVALLAGFFLFIMAATAVLGYVFVLRPARVGEAGGSGDTVTTNISGESPPAGTYLLQRALQLMGEAVPASQAAANPIRRQLISAGYRGPAAVAIFYGIKTAGMSLVGFLLFCLAYNSTGQIFSASVAALCGAGFAYRLPDTILGILTRARGSRLRRALPSALDLLVLCLEAGYSLDAAILDAGRELRHAHPDLSDELALMHLELRAGRSRVDALRLLAERTREPEIKKLVSTLVDSDRFGTSLSQDLRTHAKYLRTRMRQNAQESARKVAVKLVFPVFFLVFPSVLLVTLGPAVLQMQEQFRIILGH
jgi:tight adherence protein C